jgi:hypothetical protein
VENLQNPTTNIRQDEAIRIYLSISIFGDFYGMAPKKHRFCGGFSHDRPDFGCTEGHDPKFVGHI